MAKQPKPETVADAASPAESTSAAVSPAPEIHPRVAELMQRGFGLPLAEATFAQEQAIADLLQRSLDAKPAAEGSV